MLRRKKFRTLFQFRQQLLLPDRAFQKRYYFLNRFLFRFELQLRVWNNFSLTTGVGNKRNTSSFDKLRNRDAEGQVCIRL